MELMKQNPKFESHNEIVKTKRKKKTKENIIQRNILNLQNRKKLPEIPPLNAAEERRKVIMERNRRLRKRNDDKL